MGPGSFHYDMFKDSLKFFKDTWLRTTTVRTSLDVTHSQPSHTHTHTCSSHTQVKVSGVEYLHTQLLFEFAEGRQTNKQHQTKPQPIVWMIWMCLCLCLSLSCLCAGGGENSFSLFSTHTQTDVQPWHQA